MRTLPKSMVKKSTSEMLDKGVDGRWRVAGTEAGKGAVHLLHLLTAESNQEWADKLFS